MNFAPTIVSKLLSALLISGAVAASTGSSWALDEMGGEMVAVPVPAGKELKIDGNLADWDLSRQEWVAVAPEVAERFNAKVAVMSDDNALYLGVEAGTGGGPMINANLPNERPWLGHSLEFRCIASADAPFPFTMEGDPAKAHPNKKFLPVCKTVRIYLESVSKTPHLIIQQGPPYDNAVPNEVDPAGVTTAITEQKDRYVMEARIPWKSLGVESGKNPFKPGDKMTAFWTILWPQTRVEFLNTAPTGNFGWAAFHMKDWGRIAFSPQGNLAKNHGTMAEALEKLASSRQKGTGLEINLPAALKASVSIFDKDGNIVRELVGGEPLPAGKNTVFWDGYDWQGNPMPLGEYEWKSYASPGLKAVFLGAAGSGGDPSYPTPDGRGGWGGDHGLPIAVATDVSGTYFLWDNNEASKAFVKNKNPVNGFFSFEEEANPRPETIGLASTATEVYATAYSKHKIYVFDAATGKKLRELDCAWPRGLCVDKKGDLLAISGNVDETRYHGAGATVQRFVKGQGKGQVAVPLYGLGAPWGIATDDRGRLFVTDSGYSNQIWVYENGAHVGWIGRQGGRGFSGRYDEKAMIPESSTMNRPTEYFTPAGGTWKFAFVGVLDDAVARFTMQPNAGYVAEFKVPLKALSGLNFKPGEKLAFEAEVLLSGYGQRGFQTLSRNHLFTSRSAVASKMVDDIPTESRLYPANWGEAEVK